MRSNPTRIIAAVKVQHYMWIHLVLSFCLLQYCFAGSNEKRLINDLLSTYIKQERPVLNESDSMKVSFGLALLQIVDVDEKNQILVTNTWLQQRWTDMNLRWNVSDYGGVQDLHFSPHQLWKPDILMYNFADDRFDSTYPTTIIVYSNGSVIYVPPGIFRSRCKIDITWFPFDDQRCEMKFGSWSYNGYQMNLQLFLESGMDLTSFVTNGEWELLGAPGKRNEIYYTCCPEPYIDLTFAIIIRRRSLYYFFNLIIPCVLIASMSLLGFALPPDSGEKLSLGVTILLSLTVFLNMVAEKMPTTSEVRRHRAVPLLGIYFNSMIFMVAASVVSTILILNYHHRNAETHEMPHWVRLLFLEWLPFILRMNRPTYRDSRVPPTPCSNDSKQSNESYCRLPQNNHQKILTNKELNEQCSNEEESSTMPTCNDLLLNEKITLILTELRFIADQLRKEDENHEVVCDWKFAAMVIDRLCLITFSSFTIIATICVLLNAPNVITS